MSTIRDEGALIYTTRRVSDTNNDKKKRETHF